VAASAGRRILVVDDNRDAAASLAKLLELKGATARVAYDGRQALDALAEEPAEVVILDIGMPGLDGHEVARRIRAHPEWDGIRLIAMTGLGEAADRQRSMAAGFDRHLVKPVSFEVLDELLRHFGDSPQAPPAARSVRPREQPVPSDWDLQPPTSAQSVTGPCAASLMHDLAQPLSSAGCYAVAARTLAARMSEPSLPLRDALAGIEEQVQLASKILERLRQVLRSEPRPSAADDGHADDPRC
jgi:CheY-like chemotaxis protein